MTTMLHFRLQFAVKDDRKTSELIRTYAAQYPAKEDADAAKAGKAIRNGACTYNNFRIIYDWKLSSFLHRNLPNLSSKRHDKKGIAKALRLARDAQTVHDAMKSLIKFHGIGIRVASAVLAMIWPERYTVIDVRALRALGVSKTGTSIALYKAYLHKCRELCARYDCDLRTLDRALFEWGGQQNGRAHRINL
jgi:endonuclease III